jgi:predicted amino acid-binding ACT domain protein
MPTLHQLRVELEDRPGALARVASVLAEASVNILDIAIHEIDGSTVVDELVVDAPDDWDLAATREQLDAVGVYLLSSAEVRSREDAVLTTLSWIEDLISTPAEERDEGLARLVARAASATKACVMSAGRARQVGAGRAALDRGTVVVQRTADLPVQIAATGESLRWLLAVPDSFTDPEVVAFATRPLSLRFTSTEVARAAAVARLHRRLRAEVGV